MRRLTQNLTRHLQNKQLTQTVNKRFGAGPPAGEIRPEDVKFNPSNFVQDQSADLVSLNGFEDCNVKTYPDNTDPYDHLRNAPFLSFERLYFSDAYYHSDDHEPWMNEPHGYVTNDDPLDNRNNVERAYLEYIFYFSGALILGFTLGYQGLMLRGHSTDLFDANITAEMLEDNLRQIRISNNALEQRKAELLEQLSE